MAASERGVVRHVLMTADTVGGVWTYALELARELAALGVTTTLATMGDLLTLDQRADAARIPGMHLEESAFRLEWMDDPWRDVALAGDWLLAIEQRERPDVVHLNGYAHGALPWSAPCVVVAHSCVATWWLAVFGERPPAAYDRYRAELVNGVRAADAIVAPTRAMLQALRRCHRVARRGNVIPDGVDVARFAPGNKEPFVLGAGRLWDPAKNLVALESAAARLAWAVYVAGSGRSTDEQGSARALGRISPAALRDWMARAAVYALPAKYEPFGQSILEAALSGCALVLGDIPSLRELWQEAALYVPPHDVDALVDALERLAGDAALRSRMAIAARARGGEFTAERQARAYLDLYRHVVARRRRAVTGSTGTDTLPRQGAR